jgi:O-antigen/teichoic acid export membrane protein
MQLDGEYLASFRMRLKDLFAFVRDVLLSRTGIDMGIVYGGKILEAAVGLVSNVIVARALGPEKLGVLMLVITFSSVLTVVMGFGLDQAAVKYVADSRIMGTWPVQIVLGTALRLRLLFIVVGGLAALLLCRQIASTIYRMPDMGNALMLGVLVAGANSLFLLYQSFLRGFEKFTKMVISNTAGRILRLAFIVAIFLVSNLGVENVLWANIIAALIIVAVDMYVLKGAGVSIARGKSNRKGMAGDMIVYSSWLYLSAILFVMSDSLNILMLGNLMSVASVGFYSVANNLIRPFEYFPETINQVVLPKLSGIRDYAHFMMTSKKIILAGLIMCISLLPIVIFAKPIIHLLYGNRYEGSAIILQFLALSMGLSIVMNPLMMLCHRLHMPYLFAISTFVSVALGVVMNFLLIPKYGEVGCAITLFLVILISRGFFIPVIFMKARERLA